MAVGDVDVRITTPRAFTGTYFDGVDDKISGSFILPLDTYTVSCDIFSERYGGGGYFIMDNRNNGVGYIWADASFILDSNNSVEYVNGSSTSKNIKNNIWNNLICSGITLSGALMFGCKYNLTAEFQGIIRNIRIFEGKVSSEQISVLSNGGMPNNKLLYHFPLESNYTDIIQGATLNDYKTSSSFIFREDNLANALSGALAVTSYSGAFMIAGLAGGQILSVKIQE